MRKLDRWDESARSMRHRAVDGLQILARDVSRLSVRRKGKGIGVVLTATEEPFCVTGTRRLILPDVELKVAR